MNPANVFTEAWRVFTSESVWWKGSPPTAIELPEHHASEFETVNQSRIAILRELLTLRRYEVSVRTHGLEAPADALLLWEDAAERATPPVSPAERDRLERELRLKETQLISSRRETAIARREAEHFKAENTRLVAHLGDFAGILRNVSRVVTQEEEGDILIQESRKGTVVAVVADEVVVRYQFENDHFEQVYDRAQFLNGRLPAVGDVVEACVVIVKRPRGTTGERGELSDDFGSFQQRGVKGPFKI